MQLQTLERNSLTPHSALHHTNMSLRCRGSNLPRACWQQHLLAAVAAVTFPFCHETVTHKGGLSSLLRSRGFRRGLMRSRRPRRHCLNHQEFPWEGLPARENLTSLVKQNTPNHNVCFLLPLLPSPSDCNRKLSQAQNTQRPRKGGSVLFVSHVYTSYVLGLRTSLQPCSMFTKQGVSRIEMT